MNWSLHQFWYVGDRIGVPPPPPVVYLFCCLPCILLWAPACDAGTVPNNNNKTPSQYFTFSSPSLSHCPRTARTSPSVSYLLSSSNVSLQCSISPSFSFGRTIDWTATLPCFGVQSRRRSLTRLSSERLPSHLPNRMDCGDEDVVFFSPDDAFADEDGIPFMPCFEGSDDGDRPFAPAAEDYPIGCEVELKDIDVAKVAQTPANWEGFMDKIFSVHRRRVVVRRHLGDYSFVVCSDEEGFELIGMTLYRACLSEPKVKTTKYYSTLAGAEASKKAIELMDDKDLQEEIKRRMSLPLGPAATALAMEYGAASPRPAPHASAADDATAHGSANNNLNIVRRRSKFAIAMKFGTRELERQNYEKAIRYYNLALAEAPEEEARVVSSRSVAYCYLHQTELALRDAYRAIELQPDSHVGYVRAGNVLRGTKQFDEAKSFYKKALEKCPSDPKLQKLYADNCVAMLYALRTKKCPKLKVTHNEELGRAVVIAAQHVAPNVVLLAETTSLMSVIHLPHHPVSCAHCCRPFMNETEACRHVPGLQPELLQQLHSAATPITCRYCHVAYCSDNCRTRAWAEHHWVECRSRGRWRRGLREMDKYLKNYVGGETYRPTDTPNDNHPTTVAACCFIAVRMMSRMSSCVWTLKDAVEMYNWLQVGASVSSARDEVRPILEKCFNFVKEGFIGEEQTLLTYELFEICYERSKTHAVGMYMSTWDKVVKKANERLTLIKERRAQMQISKIVDNEEDDKLEAVLQTVACTPATSVPGTYTYALCVFELHALTMMPNTPPSKESNSRHRRPPQPPDTLTQNVEIGSVILPDNREGSGHYLQEPYTTLSLQNFVSLAHKIESWMKRHKHPIPLAGRTYFDRLPTLLIMTHIHPSCFLLHVTSTNTIETFRHSILSVFTCHTR
eukprot:gene8373-5862_t